MKLSFGINSHKGNQRRNTIIRKYNFKLPGENFGKLHDFLISYNGSFINRNPLLFFLCVDTKGLHSLAVLDCLFYYQIAQCLLGMHIENKFRWGNSGFSICLWLLPGGSGVCENILNRMSGIFGGCSYFCGFCKIAGKCASLPLSQFCQPGNIIWMEQPVWHRRNI